MTTRALTLVGRTVVRPNPLGSPEFAGLCVAHLQTLATHHDRAGVIR